MRSRDIGKLFAKLRDDTLRSASPSTIVTQVVHPLFQALDSHLVQHADGSEPTADENALSSAHRRANRPRRDKGTASPSTVMSCSPPDTEGAAGSSVGLFEASSSCVASSSGARSPVQYGQEGQRLLHLVKGLRINNGTIITMEEMHDADTAALLLRVGENVSPLDLTACAAWEEVLEVLTTWSAPISRRKQRSNVAPPQLDPHAASTLFTILQRLAKLLCDALESSSSYQLVPVFKCFTVLQIAGITFAQDYHMMTPFEPSDIIFDGFRKLTQSWCVCSIAACGEVIASVEELLGALCVVDQVRAGTVLDWVNANWRFRAAVQEHAFDSTRCNTSRFSKDGGFAARSDTVVCEWKPLFVDVGLVWRTLKEVSNSFGNAFENFVRVALSSLDPDEALQAALHALLLSHYRPWDVAVTVPLICWDSIDRFVEDYIGQDPLSYVLKHLIFTKPLPNWEDGALQLLVHHGYSADVVLHDAATMQRPILNPLTRNILQTLKDLMQQAPPSAASGSLVHAAGATVVIPDTVQRFFAQTMQSQNAAHNSNDSHMHQTVLQAVAGSLQVAFPSLTNHQWYIAVLISVAVCCQPMNKQQGEVQLIASAIWILSTPMVTGLLNTASPLWNEALREAGVVVPSSTEEELLRRLHQAV